MKTAKILVILVLALGLMVCSVQVSEAAPIGTAFTYQGRLMDANEPANGLYDFQFELYDSAVDGNHLDLTVAFRGVDVIDGYFTLALDFGSDVFTGDAWWLEIGVKLGGVTDPFTLLSPRQELTPAPYSIYAQKAGTDNDWQVSGDDMYSIPSGNVGIGTSSPLSRLSAGGDGFVNTGVYGNGSDYGVYGNSSTYGVFGRGGYSGVHGRDDDSGSLGRLGYATYGVYGNGTVYGGYFLGAGYFSGDVGIGTESPEAKLGIASPSSGAALGVGRASSEPSIVARSDADGGWLIMDSTGSGKTGLNYYDDGDVILVHGGGNVGIGTTEPEATLEVTNSGGKPAIEASSSWIGVKGTHSSTSGSFPGVWGATDSLASGANGIRGVVNTTSPGSDSAGVRGTNNGTNNNGSGVLGSHAGGGNGVQGTSVSGNAVLGQSDSGYGVFGVSQSDIGVIGISASGTKPGGAFFGGVSIGMYTIPTGISLAVDGKILCEEVEVQLSEDWPDYVFEQDYELMPLEKLGQYVREKKHLPNVTTAEEVGSSGISLGQAQTQMLRKIEELTLYVVDLNQQLSNVRQENKSLQNRITALERK